MKQPLRIAFFTYSTKLRGSVVHTLELAEALHQLGHHVCVYALDKDGAGFERPLRCHYQPVPAQPAPSDLDQLIHQRIQEFVGYFNTATVPAYDCYHAQDCISANALAILRQQNRILHFCRTVHHIDEFNSVYLQQCQERSIQQPDLCFCVSQYWQQQLQQRYGIQPARVINGVDLNRFSPNLNGAEAHLKQQLGLTGDPIYLTVGGIEPRKNSIRLLQAFAQILVAYPQAQLVIAGGATLFDYQPYRDQFFAAAARLGVAESLILPGVIADTDLPALYRSADVFVFPSLKEGWGLVVLEAIACGLPVITANQPPFTEFLDHHQALLVDPQLVSAIAAAMQSAVEADSVKAVKEMPPLDQYSWQKSAKMHLDHYSKLLNYA